MKKNKKIAIKGSDKEGIKVIEYLESIGGNKSDYAGNNFTAYYFIREDGRIDFTYRPQKLIGYKFYDKIPTFVNKFELWRY